MPQFAKHMKVEEQVNLLQNKKIGIGVGTPARLMELIDNGEYMYLPARHFDFHSNYMKTSMSTFRV